MKPKRAKSKKRQDISHGHTEICKRKDEPLVQKVISKLSPMLNLIAPLLWPKARVGLQILVILSGLSVVLGCVVNLYVPIYAQKIVDSLTFSVESRDEAERLEFKWDLVLIFILLKVCQGIGALSLITCIQQVMWISLEQHARHQIQVKFFSHLHQMSLAWLLHQKTGSILGALERGTESLASTLEHLIYSVVPTIADILIALSYLTYKFGWTFSAIIGIQIMSYLVLTTILIEKRSKHQSGINQAENTLNQQVFESLLNFEIVKSFGNEAIETLKFSKSLQRLQAKQFQVGLITSMLQSTQLLVIYSGMLGCSLLVISKIIGANGELSVGDYVLCTSYLAQLYGPLNYLGGYYKELRVNLIDMQCMLEYLDEEPEIKNSPVARTIPEVSGAAEFKNVSLVSDSGEVILQNINFSVPPNSTVALVGHSGSGKTSIARLLLRIMDATCGHVFVHGMDVKDLTLDSLRESIGVIPQDTALFNDTIRNNIKYGKLDADDYEMAAAATAAQIHNKILCLPNGYDTIVGERGTRLSGGERQRIAIARAILKDPKILILDEATSALDTKTEKEIQLKLKQLCRNRTCIMITHRLKSAADADLILVLKKGQIVERGKHQKLLDMGGIYGDMWRQQEKGNKEIDRLSPHDSYNRHL